MEVARLSELEPFVTKDGSTIRELAGPAWAPVRNQSLAEASVPPGGETDEHYHVEAEEIYYFVAGAGRMRLGDEEQDLAAGDCVASRRASGTSSGIAPRSRSSCCAAADRPTTTTTP